MRTKLARRLKDRRGFTLIELAMVVAVIVILAAVLIPRIGAVRKEAKFTGALQNANLVRGTLEILIDKSNYQHSTNGPELLGEALEAKLDALDGSGTNDETDATNAYNGSDALITAPRSTDTPNDNAWETWSNADRNAVVAIDWNNTDAGGAPTWSANTWKDSDLAGCVMVAIYKTSNGQVWADVMPYDGDGNPVEDSKQVVKP